jgi:acetyl esterase/lipase
VIAIGRKEMVPRSTAHLKFGATTATAYALKAIFSSLDLVGNRLILQRSARKLNNLVSEVAYGVHSKQRMTLIRPAQSEPCPLLIYFHGGGFVLGDRHGYAGICGRLAEQGYLVCNANYRLAPRYRYASQLRDVANAVRWAYEHAEQYGGDRNRIFLAGDSAGALHASWYVSALHNPALRADFGIEHVVPSDAIRAMLLFYGVFDLVKVLASGFPFIRTYVHSFLGDLDGQFIERARLVSPVRYVSALLPPTFLCAAETDPLFSQSVAYARVLQDNQVETITLFLSRSEHPGSGHGFLYFLHREDAKLVFRETARFLDQHR